MDGSAIIARKSDEEEIKAFTIDRKNAILYYATSRVVKSINYLTGFNGVSSDAANYTASSLAVSNDVLFFIMEVLDTYRVSSCSLVNSVCENYIEESSTITDLKEYNVDPPVAKNPCGDNNGGCQHLCVLTAANENGYTCECNLYWQLNSDSKNCSPINEYLLYGDDGVIQGRLLDLKKVAFSDVNVSIISDGSAFDYDSRRNSIVYKSDAGLHYANLKNRVEWTFVDSQKCIQTPAIDWVSNKLYYIFSCDDVASYLLVQNIDVTSGLNDKKTVLEIAGRVSSMVIHPNRGLIFFAQCENGSSKCTLRLIDVSGKELKTLRSIHETGLAIDYSDDRLYFLNEDATGVLYLNIGVSLENLANLDGKTIALGDVTRDMTSLNSISVYDKRIYIANSDRIICLDKDSSEELGSLPPAFSDAKKSIHGVKVFSKALQPIDEAHPCVVNNGDCQRYCFGVPITSSGQLTKICGCHDNEKLQEDGRTCVNVGS